MQRTKLVNFSTAVYGHVTGGELSPFDFGLRFAEDDITLELRRLARVDIDVA